MNTCMWGLGWMRDICGKASTQVVELGWPMCDEHADRWEHWEA